MQDNTQTVTVLLIVNVLSFILPKIGVNLGNDVITSTVQVILTVGSAVWVYFSHKKVVGAAKVAGVIK